MRLPYRFGRYTLVEKIAAGGTAEVYRAVLSAENGFAKTVAVKRLLPLWGGNDELRAMLIDEARALVCLQHQAIVQVLELGSEGDIPFIAMEFVDGIDCGRLLNDVIRGGEYLPMAHALYIVGQILLALEFAHRTVDAGGRPLGIVHRDISPSNILLSWNGEVKVTDFGIAKGLHRTKFTATGQLKGKYAYMSPEQAGGKAIDARSDLFSCGIIMYELLSGTRLFDAPTDFEAVNLVRRVRIPPDPIRQLPAQVRAILILALAKDRDKRYQSAKEMLTDIQRASRALGEIGSSLDLASFLRGRFPGEAVRPPDPRADALGDEPRTRVLDEGAMQPAGVQSRLGGPLKRRAKHLARLGLVASMLGAIAVMPFGMNEGSTKPPPAVSEKMSEDVRPVLPPPDVEGAIAIDSAPSGAAGTLTLGGKVEGFVTPFAVEGIKVGDGIDGRIEIGKAGYESISHDFRLARDSPALVKNFALKRAGEGRISIHARPWGFASIDGVLARRETPVNGLKLKAGTYVVRVDHPPTGSAVKKMVDIADNQSRRCIAAFGRVPEFSCR